MAAAEQVLAAATSRREEAELAEAAEARSYAAQLRAVADRREGLARLTGQVNSLQSRLQTLGEEEARLQARLAEALARAEDAEHQYALLEMRLGGVSDGVRSREQDAERLCATLAARIDALKLGLQRRDASGALLAGELADGLLGSLSGMVKVDPAWQQAVSAALGTATEALVVTDLVTALDTFDRLKTEDLGRAGLLLGDAPGQNPAEWPELPDSRLIPGSCPDCGSCSTKWRWCPIWRRPGRW